MTNFPPLEAMDEEHEAWRELCRRLGSAMDGLTTGATVDTDVNDPRFNPLIAQIKYWGETLHKLRLADPRYDEKAYAEYRAEAATT